MASRRGPTPRLSWPALYLWPGMPMMKRRAPPRERALRGLRLTEAPFGTACISRRGDHGFAEPLFGRTACYDDATPRRRGLGARHARLGYYRRPSSFHLFGAHPPRQGSLDCWRTYRRDKTGRVAQEE